MSDTILVTTDGPLRTITLNRPDKLNAFNEDMHLAFRAALERQSETNPLFRYKIKTQPKQFHTGKTPENTRYYWLSATYE